MIQLTQIRKFAGLQKTLPQSKHLQYILGSLVDFPVDVILRFSHGASLQEGLEKNPQGGRCCWQVDTSQARSTSFLVDEILSFLHGDPTIHAIVMCVYTCNIQEIFSYVYLHTKYRYYIFYTSILLFLTVYRLNSHRILLLLEPRKESEGRFWNRVDTMDMDWFMRSPHEAGRINGSCTCLRRGDWDHLSFLDFHPDLGG